MTKKKHTDKKQLSPFEKLVKEVIKTPKKEIEEAIKKDKKTKVK